MWYSEMDRVEELVSPDLKCSWQDKEYTTTTKNCLKVEFKYKNIDLKKKMGSRFWEVPEHENSDE